MQWQTEITWNKDDIPNEFLPLSENMLVQCLGCYWLCLISYYKKDMNSENNNIKARVIGNRVQKCWDLQY